MNVKKGEIFNSVQVATLPRNTFDLTHQHATTADFADLIPICTMEAVPGDIFDITSETFIRFQPMITPMMHRCDFTVHYFFVPNRILWDGWEDFITGNLALVSGLNTPSAPFFTSEALAPYDDYGSVLNYMGCEVNAFSKINSGSPVDVQVSALPLAAYQKIYYDYYIPRELVTPGTDFQKLSDGNNNANVVELTTLRKKGWLRDYFTSALPYAQKGDDVALPIGNIPETSLRRQQAVGDGASFLMDGLSQPGAIAGSGIAVNANSTTPLAVGTLFFPETPVGTTTINDLRRAMRLQEWLEKNARAGTRYSESLRSHFNVTSSDARLQRAEYITGIKAPIIVSEVLNTAGDGSLPQGNMSGHGIGIGESYRDKFFCEEHGWVIGVLSVTPRPAYTTGLPRFLTKRADFMDYYWYEFANIGEQEIEQIELQCTFGGGTKSPRDVFGYIPRYAEYKFKNDMITGQFADKGLDVGDEGPLRTWVMQRGFGTEYSGDANLNEGFITGDIKTVASAPFAVEDSPILIQQVNKLKVSRLMPVFGTPTF